MGVNICTGAEWGQVMFRERQKRKAACVGGHLRGWGCTCVGRRCGEVGRALFKEG